MSSLLRVAQQPAGHDDTPHLRQRDGALRLARLGYHVVPEHEVNDDGRCSCSHASCRKPGKHPRTPNGYKDATRDEATIRAWWQQWPRANIGFDAGASGVAIIGPDAPEWLDELQRRGLPDTVRVQTGSGPGHEHHHYRRPEGCPVERVCIPGQFDIMSAGNIIAPGSVTTGPYIALTELRPVAKLPPLPGWAVEMLVAEVERKSAQNAPAPRPPSTLTLSDHEILQKARAATNGHLFERLYDGDVTAHDGQDKSASGADLALLSKLAFWCRGDEAQTERLFQTSELYRPEKWRGSYRANTLRKALSRQSFYEPPLARPTITNITTARPQPSNGSRDVPPVTAFTPERLTQSDPTGCVMELARIADLEQALAERDEKLTRLQERVRNQDDELHRLRRLSSLQSQFLKNPDMADGPKLMLLALAPEIAGIKSGAGAPVDPSTPDPRVDGDAIKINCTTMAERIGCHPDVAGKRISKLVEAKLFKKRYRPIIIRNDDTGQMMNGGKELLLVTQHGTVEAIFEAGATAATPGRANQGGARVKRCAAHPDALLVKRTEITLACSECGEIVDKSVAKQTVDPNRQIIGSGDAPPASVDDVLISDDSSVRVEFHEARARHFDVQDEESDANLQPVGSGAESCSDCHRPLRNAEERELGRHAYNCSAADAPGPPQPVWHGAPNEPLFATMGDDYCRNRDAANASRRSRVTGR
jgi:hypothetical protein